MIAVIIFAHYKQFHAKVSLNGVLRKRETAQIPKGRHLVKKTHLQNYGLRKRGPHDNKGVNTFIYV